MVCHRAKRHPHMKKRYLGLIAIVTPIVVILAVYLLRPSKTPPRIIEPIPTETSFTIDVRVTQSTAGIRMIFVVMNLGRPLEFDPFDIPWVNESEANLEIIRVSDGISLPACYRCVQFGFEKKKVDHGQITGGSIYLHDIFPDLPDCVDEDVVLKYSFDLKPKATDADFSLTGQTRLKVRASTFEEIRKRKPFENVVIGQQ